MQNHLYRYRYDAERGPWLEFVASDRFERAWWAWRRSEHPFAAKRCDDACGVRCEGVSSTCSPSTVQSDARMPDHPWKSDSWRRSRFKGRSDEAGCLATVEVELEFETPSHLTPQASIHSPHLKRIVRASPGPPSPLESITGDKIRARDRIRHNNVNRPN